MKNSRLLRAEIIKIIGDFKVYWFNYLFGNLNIYFLFLGIFYAFQKSTATPKDTFNLLVGLMIWYYGVHAIDLIAIIIEEEAQEGTLDQIFITRTNFVTVLFNRIIAQLIFDTVKGIFVFFLCIITFKIPLDFIKSINWLWTLSIFFFTLIGLYGIGYMVAGLSILYKKTTAIAGTCSNLLLFFTGIIIDLDKLPSIFMNISKALPLYWGMQSLNSLIENDFKILKVIGSSTFIYLVVSCSFWILLGLITFNLCQKKAKVQGSLNRY